MCGRRSFVRRDDVLPARPPHVVWRHAIHKELVRHAERRHGDFFEWACVLRREHRPRVYSAESKMSQEIIFSRRRVQNSNSTAPLAGRALTGAPGGAVPTRRRPAACLPPWPAAWTTSGAGRPWRRRLTLWSALRASSTSSPRYRIYSKLEDGDREYEQESRGVAPPSRPCGSQPAPPLRQTRA